LGKKSPDKQAITGDNYGVYYEICCVLLQKGRQQGWQNAIACATRRSNVWLPGAAGSALKAL